MISILISLLEFDYNTVWDHLCLLSLDLRLGQNIGAYQQLSYIRVCKYHSISLCASFTKAEATINQLEAEVPSLEIKNNLLSVPTLYRSTL